MKLAPPLSNGEGPPTDDLEALLRAYFRAEMPQPWPAPPLVRAEPQPAAARDRGGRHRSRLALAASVALLVGGSMLLPGRASNRPSPEKLPSLLPGEAIRPTLPEQPAPTKGKLTEKRKHVTEDAAPRK
jgi:hypothetical protein